MKTVVTADCEGATGNLHVPLVCALGKRLWNVGTILNLADKLVNLTLRSSSLLTFLLAFLPKEDPNVSKYLSEIARRGAQERAKRLSAKPRRDRSKGRQGIRKGPQEESG